MKIKNKSCPSHLNLIFDFRFLNAREKSKYAFHVAHKKDQVSSPDSMSGYGSLGKRQPIWLTVPKYIMLRNLIVLTAYQQPNAGGVAESWILENWMFLTQVIFLVFVVAGFKSNWTAIRSQERREWYRWNSNFADFLVHLIRIKTFYHYVFQLHITFRIDFPNCRDVLNTR